MEKGETMRTLGSSPSPHTHHFPWGKKKLKTHEIHQMVVFCAEVNSQKSGASPILGDLLSWLLLDSSLQGCCASRQKEGRCGLGCT